MRNSQPIREPNTVGALDTSAESKARQALSQQYTQPAPAAAPPTTARPTPTATTQAPAVTPPPARTEPAPAVTTSRPTSPPTTQRPGQQLPQVDVPVTAAPTTPPTVAGSQTQAPVDIDSIVESDAYKTKAERLSALTRLYQMDMVTPRDYHQARAKILAKD
jgi:hypothetical protein